MPVFLCKLLKYIHFCKILTRAHKNESGKIIIVCKEVAAEWAAEYARELLK